MVSELNTGNDIFKCRLCGDCCNGFGGTYVSAEDIKNISDYINDKPEQFIKKYCDPSGSRLLLSTGNNGTCIFFDTDKQCTIHPVKPYMCRAWPFIKTIIKNPENWNAMANSCQGMKKNIPAADLKRIVSEEKDKLDRSIGRQSDHQKK